MNWTNPDKGLGKDPGWVRITWTEALDLVAPKLLSTMNDHGRHSIPLLSRPKPDIRMRSVNAIGTPNRCEHLGTCYQSRCPQSSRRRSVPTASWSRTGSGISRRCGRWHTAREYVTATSFLRKPWTISLREETWADRLA